jgi:hypothetical protein
MSPTTVLLRPVDKANNSINTAAATPCMVPETTIPCARVVDNQRLVHIRVDVNNLLAGYDPVILRDVHRHLDTPAADDRIFLDAWERCGRNDWHHGQRVGFKQAAKSTLTALGIACLVRYARGYVDEAEAEAAGLTAPKGSSGRAQDGVSRRPPSGQPRGARVRSTAPRKKARSK